MTIISPLKKFNNNIEKILSENILSTLNILYNISLKEDKNIFLAGGTVRDILLGKKFSDIDLVFLGDVEKLGLELLKKFETKEFRFNKKFLTFKIILKNKITIDIASPRIETYEHSGALPCVTKSVLEKDFFRRDFTINSLYIKLDNEISLLDYSKGLNDLENKIIRILHPNSFIDDPTRILRGIKFLSRYNFNLENNTKALMLQGLSNNLFLNISSDRLKSELFKLFNENNLENIIFSLNKFNIFSFFDLSKFKITNSKKIIKLYKKIIDFDLHFKNNKKTSKEHLLLFLFFIENTHEKIFYILNFFNFSKKNIKFLLTIKDFYISYFN